MTYSSIDSSIEFHGNWPEMLRAKVEDLILQHDPQADPAPDAGRLPENDPPSKRFSGAGESAPERAAEPSPWIAQHNPSPTGPLYAIGRMARSGREALGPVLCSSGKALLDKLRRLLNTQND